MPPPNAALFTLTETIALLGLVQSVYILVYMFFRSGSVRNALVPCLYFLALAAAFFMDAAAGHWQHSSAHYETLQWLLWFSGIPLGALLIFQIAQVPEPPQRKYFLLLLLIPISFLPSFFFSGLPILYVSGLVIGAFSLLAIWLRRDLLDGLRGQAKFGKERFWLILTLIGLMTTFLAVTFAFVGNHITADQWVLIRNILGITFAYVAATSLFRIYPQAFKRVREEGAGEGAQADIPATDRRILDRLKILLDQDKIYQDATYGRTELARELEIGEASLSRIINTHYGRTIPQILNDYRVRDAQRMLKETDAPIQIIFEESGFNSVTTFNRVFKELSGETPKDFRLRIKA